MQQFGAETEQEQYNTKVKENSRQLNLFRWRTSPPNRSLCLSSRPTPTSSPPPRPQHGVPAHCGRHRGLQGAASPPQQQAGHAAETGSDATFVPGRNSLVHHFQVFAVWHSKDKLSIEIELGGDCRYHAVKPDQAVNLAWRAAVQQCSGRETHHSGVSFRPA